MQSFEMLAATVDPFALTEYHVLGEDPLNCAGCCPLAPERCIEYCLDSGYDTGQCGGLAEEECICSN